MKIALLTPYDYPYPGGVTEHVRHLDREFRARGHETRVIVASSQPQNMLADNVIKVSDTVIPVPFNGSSARISLAPEALQRVVEVLNDERFDIVHLHEPAAPLLSWAALESSRAVNVGTFHAYQDDRTFYSYARPLFEWVSQNLDGRIFVSPVVRDTVGPLVPGDFRVIPNGIDAQRFAAPGIQPLPPLDDGRPNILFVGRLEPRKGFAHLLNAYPAVKRAIPEARLLVAGAYSAEEKARLADAIRGRGLVDIHLVGRVSSEDLPRYYRTATVFCAPSTGGESFGIILLEAMAGGLPIVASNIAGYRSVMQDGVQGRLVPAGDSAALANALVALLRDPRLRAQMAAQGRLTARGYDWSIVAPQVLGYYEALLQAGPARRSPPKIAFERHISAAGQTVNIDLRIHI